MHRPRARDRLHPRLQPLDRRLLQADRRRLLPIAHISLLDPDGRGRGDRAARARTAASASTSRRTSPRAAAGSSTTRRSRRFWETVQDLEMPVAFHVVVRDQPVVPPWLRKRSVRRALRLRVPRPRRDGRVHLDDELRPVRDLPAAPLRGARGGLELDHGVARPPGPQVRGDGAPTPIRMPPSEYFYRQCMISAEPDESLTAPIVEHLGADYFIWASDYPHLDASFDVVMRAPRAPRAALRRGRAARCWARTRCASTSWGGRTSRTPRRSQVGGSRIGPKANRRFPCLQ